MKKVSILWTLGVVLWADVKFDEIKVDTNQYDFDKLNRNVYFMDSERIEKKGFSSTKQVLQSLPFVVLNDAGLGGNADLRGQGISSNVNTQILLNGVSLNMLDSSHGVTPFDSVSVGEIEHIEVLPGGGAVMYGSGTRGGVINIVTKKRYERLIANLTAGYRYSHGSNANFNLKLGGKAGERIYYSLGGNYLFSQGYRDDDLRHLGGVNANLTWDINANHSLGFDVNYFIGKEDTTPALRFSEIENPSKTDRTKAGNGEISTLQNRISLGLNYSYSLSEDQKLILKSFFHLYKIAYQKNFQTLNYAYGGFNFPQAHTNQKGSYFLDSKVGLQAQYELSHQNGLLLLGAESIYAQGERDLRLDIDWKGSIAFPPGRRMQNISYAHQIYTSLNAKKWSNSLYAIENYHFTSSFSLSGGARYEFSWYGGKRNLKNQMVITKSPLQYQLNKNISKLTHNFALELTPRYKFDAGDVYAKYERGFRSPSPDNLTSRTDTRSRKGYIDTNVKSETYDTFEVGSKFFAGDNALFLLTGFYTLTHNEIFTIGSAHTGNGFKVGNYKLTQRAGIEVAGEQEFFDGILGLSQSFSYIDARILDSGFKGIKSHSLIPYVSQYKAMLGANYRFFKGWNLWINTSLIGRQKDPANNTIPAYHLTDLGMDYSYKHFSLSFGVRNVSDTFYYRYYNKDKSDEITGYAFLIGEGRSYFLEGRYKF